MLNREDREELYRILDTYDRKTLIELLESYMSDKEKKNFIEDYHRED